MTGVLTPPRCRAAEPWAAGTPIDGNVTAGPIVDALARQESMLVPQTTQRFVVLARPMTALPTAGPHDLALFSVLPLAAPTAPVPLVGAAFDQVHRLASIALQPLVAPAVTATYLQPLRIAHRYALREPRITSVPQSRAYRAFTELTAWLGMTQEETAALLGIGRTTPLAWRRGHEPQPARARRLFQTHALVKTLVRRLGTDEARRWLGRETPSPLELIRSGNVAAADDRAEAVIFDAAVPSRLDAWVDNEAAAPTPTHNPTAAATLRRVRRRDPRRR